MEHGFCLISLLTQIPGAILWDLTIPEYEFVSSNLRKSVTACDEASEPGLE